MMAPPSHARDWTEDRNTVDGRVYLAEIRGFHQLGWSFALVPRRDPDRQHTLYMAALTMSDGCYLTPRMLAELGPLRLEAGHMILSLAPPWDVAAMMDEALPGILLRALSYNGEKVEQQEWTRLAASDIPASGMVFTPEPDLNLRPKGWPR